MCEANESINKQTEAKIISKMETTLKNRETQLNNLMARLKEHVCSTIQYYNTKHRLLQAMLMTAGECTII